MDWSYNLLDAGEQTLFRRLGVFVGGCSLEAIEQVCGSELGLDPLDGVTSLVSKSLLHAAEGVAGSGEARFTMLETIRQYAREKLADIGSSKGGDLPATRERHCDYFLRLAEAAEQGTLGNEQALWMRRLDTEQNNLRAVLEWSLSPEGQPEKGLRLVGALMRYWDNKGYFSEGRQWCTTATEQDRVDGARRWSVLRRSARWHA